MEALEVKTSLTQRIMGHYEGDKISVKMAVRPLGFIGGILKQPLVS